jgi:hypothetical protein
MEKVRCIIEVIKPKEPGVDPHLDSLGISHHEQPGQLRFRNIETEEEYVHLDGALAWPGKDCPGFVLVVGVRTEGKLPRFFCLEEAVDFVPKGLLMKCLTLRQRYGFGLSEFLFPTWFGDSDRYPSLVAQFNDEIRLEKDEPEGVILQNPTDMDKKNNFELYLHRIYGALTPDETGGKMLSVEIICSHLMNAIQSVPKDGTYSLTKDDNPPVFALGGLLHSLLTTKGWIHRSSQGRADENWESYALKDREKDPYSGGGRGSNQAE